VFLNVLCFKLFVIFFLKEKRKKEKKRALTYKAIVGINLDSLSQAEIVYRPMVFVQTQMGSTLHDYVHPA
jgi:hypothetical protein